MPCNSDYMEASSFEVAMSQVLCLLAEIRTGKPVDADSDNWRGYHPEVYNGQMSKKDRNKAVAELCEIIGAMSSAELKAHSLELQIWWRNHQAIDKARIEKENQEHKEALIREAALSKLSLAERKALGLTRFTMACKLIEELLVARHSLTKTYEEIRTETKAENFIAAVKK